MALLFQASYREMNRNYLRKVRARPRQTPPLLGKASQFRTIYADMGSKQTPLVSYNDEC